MTKTKSKKQALIGNFFKRKYEEINDNDSSPNVGNDIQANDDVDASPNVDNENIQANDDDVIERFQAMKKKRRAQIY
ncbi:hypothetical protein Hanom_Chr10g00898481 [Helianthus anomalus]